MVKTPVECLANDDELMCMSIQSGSYLSDHNNISPLVFDAGSIKCAFTQTDTDMITRDSLCENFPHALTGFDGLDMFDFGRPLLVEESTRKDTSSSANPRSNLNIYKRNRGYYC